MPRTVKAIRCPECETLWERISVGARSWTCPCGAGVEDDWIEVPRDEAKHAPFEA